MPSRRPRPAGSKGGRWIVAQRDISEHIAGSPPAHLALVYDPAADLIVAAGVESSVDAAVAAAFGGIQSPPTAGPRTLACDPRVIGAVRLNIARFRPAPDVVAAANAELRTVTGLFDDFLATGPSGRAHALAVAALQEPARQFVASTCWARRADMEPLLLDASIDGDRAGGIVSVMGNGGETWGVSIFPDGDRFNDVITSDHSGMPPDGVLSCVLDRRALGDATIPAVEMAVTIRDGEAEPVRGREVQLLHVALVAAAGAPPVGDADPVSGSVSAPDFKASYVVFDIEGAERRLPRERAAPASSAMERSNPRKPAVRFGALPRAVAETLVSPEDELAASSLLAALPKTMGMPAVFVRFDTDPEAKAFVRRIESGGYLGVAAGTTPIGTALRVIGRGEPLEIGVVGTNWPPLRGFMRRRERSGGLHALVVATAESDDIEGIFVCVLPQPAAPAPLDRAGRDASTRSGRQGKRTSKARRTR